MKLRARFTLALALVALLPIAVAALVTRQILARRVYDDQNDNRAAVLQTAKREIARLQQSVRDAGQALSDRDHPLTGAILRELIKGGGKLDPEAMRKLREQSGPTMRGLGLDVLTITNQNNEVLVSPHLRAAIGERDDAIAARAKAGLAEVRFVAAPRPSSGLSLFASVGSSARDGQTVVHVVVGREVNADLLGSIRREKRVDARIKVGETVVVKSQSDWLKVEPSELLSVEFAGFDGKKIGDLDVYIRQDDLGDVVRNITLAAIGLAVFALVMVVLIGTMVAKRTTRDLDALVQGSVAAARGDLDFRIAVHSSDEVGEVARSFNFMMEDLKASKDRLVIAERIAAWQEIARRLAHEIKNPLTPIQMAMDTLRKTWRKKHPSFDEILEESTSTVLQEADRLKRIVSEFSDFARMPKPDFSSISLGDVVTSGLALYQGSVKVELSPCPTIEADKNQMQQVLLNLVENARDAVAKRFGEATDRAEIGVRVALGGKSDRVVWTIADNGIGVDDEYKDKVFAPYFSTKLTQGGTGLGLAIVHRIISDHGGRIVVSDTPGGGATFTIELPLTQQGSLLASRM